MLHEVRPVADILEDLWNGGEAAYRRAQQRNGCNASERKPCPCPSCRAAWAWAFLWTGWPVPWRPAAAWVCISTADAGYREPDFARDPTSANHRALTAEIRKAKQIANGAGMVAINAMVATQDYAAAIRTAVEAGVDAVVSGAGLPLELPGLAGTRWRSPSRPSFPADGRQSSSCAAGPRSSAGPRRFCGH